MTMYVTLDEQLVQEAMKYAPVKTKRELMDLALREYIANHTRPDIRALKGKIAFYDGFDHKTLCEIETEISKIYS